MHISRLTDVISIGTPDGKRPIAPGDVVDVDEVIDGQTVAARLGAHVAAFTPVETETPLTPKRPRAVAADPAPDAPKE